MLPSFAMNYSIHVSGAEFENTRKLTLGVGVSVKKPYFQNYLSSQFGKSVFLTNTTPSLGNHITGIVRVCSKKEMIWINTGPIVATVKHAKSIRNNASVDNPRYDMSADGAILSFPPRHSSISCLKRTSCPQPAIICFIYTIPKSFLKVLGKALRIPDLIRNVVLHSKTVLLCRALGCFSNAEAFSISRMTSFGLAST